MIDTKKKKTILIALGGNALQRVGEKGTAEEQLFHIRKTANHCADILQRGYSLVITHGNGPQIGSILLQQEHAKDQLPPMPLDICGAQSQGMIGYMMQQQLYNQIREKKIETPHIVALCTQTLVDRHDPAFTYPTKPIGPFYTKEKANALHQTKKWRMMEQKGKGFRRVVPSPMPVDIIEGEMIKKLITMETLVIACGGGGIPVSKDKEGHLIGVEAVIDKDHTAALLGHKIGAEILMILTDIEQVALNFGTTKQINLNHLTIEEANKHLKAGEFGAGSMGPKVEAASTFMQLGGEKAIITSLEKAHLALKGTTGTSITK